MKALLNAKIKRRESFRPFAPSILEDAVSEWFEENDAVPFIMQVFQIREEKRELIPAVTHVDGSGRLQTISCRANPRYYRLIEAFRAITNVPMVLNTSFNENEPVVCNPEEALRLFSADKNGLLVMENTSSREHRRLETVQACKRCLPSSISKNINSVVFLLASRVCALSFFINFSAANMASSACKLFEGRS
jgi:predicted NodU family carbamoyl transferase